VPATVREVAAAADPATRTFLVKADTGTAPVRLGQTASVRVDAPPVDGAIRLPLSAVVESQGRSMVWLFDRTSMTVRQQPVTVAGADGNQVLIAQGLKPGDEVVTAGTHVLTPGQKVKPFTALAGGAPAASAPSASVAAR
jgi:RND family efflux transporter MFP subunit